jgi:hypothetical protein
MMSFWSSTVSSGALSTGGGGVSFNATIQVVNADNTISLRHMNPHGGYYDAEENVYEEDGSQSFNLDASQTDEDGLTFMDAVQDLVHQQAKYHTRVAHNALGPLPTGDDDLDGKYFHSLGYDSNSRESSVWNFRQLSSHLFSSVVCCSVT